ncbi:MAG: hypothetical protein V1764_03230, partial [Nitrospirota bacterium]
MARKFFSLPLRWAIICSFLPMVGVSDHQKAKFFIPYLQEGAIIGSGLIIKDNFILSEKLF